MTNAPIYDTNAVHLLAEKTEYEDWLLEQVYVIVKQELYPDFPDVEVVYSVDKPKPQFTTCLSCNANMGDWRPGFHSVGAPLILIVTFKILDMFIEWVLERNGNQPNYRFHRKLEQLALNPIFPTFIETRHWLKERLVKLYETLESLRGTIIHNKDFSFSDGFLQVGSSKSGSSGAKIEISQTKLQQLSFTIVSVMRYVSGTWLFDAYQEKLLRYNLDNLEEFHTFPALGQLQPLYTTVTFFSQDADPQYIDTFKIYRDIAEHYPNRDCTFDLQVLIVREGVAVDAFYFPCTDLQKGYPEWSRNIKIDDFRVEIPEHIDFL